MSNFRVKIGLGVTVLLTVLTVGLYALVIMPLGKAVEEDVRASVMRASHLVQRSQQLHAFELVSMVSAIAGRREFADSFRIMVGNGP